MSPQPRGNLLTHGHGDEELDGEVQPGVEAAAAALGDGAAMEEVLLPKTAAWEEENSWYGASPRVRFPLLIYALGFPSSPLGFR